jgi:hypothetical protein
VGGGRRGGRGDLCLNGSAVYPDILLSRKIYAPTS